MARISSVTFEYLKKHGVDAVKLAKCINEAYSKKTELDFVVSQSKKVFKVTTKDEITRLELTEEQDYSMTVAAFDSYMIKGMKRFQDKKAESTDVMEWTVLPSMVQVCRQYWPGNTVEVVNKETVTEEVNA